MIAARARAAHIAARRRLADDGDDSGFVLIYTLMVVTVVTVLVGSVLVVSSSSVVPSVQSAYSNAADAAAQGGVQAFLAYANTNCQNTNSSVQGCSLPQLTNPNSDSSGWTTIASEGTYAAKYKWSAQKDPNNGYFRVQATGTVMQGGINSTRTVVADVSGGASTDVRDYAVVTGYETQSPDVVQAAFPARSVSLGATAASKADLVPGSGATSVSWDGATATSGVTSCNNLYYGATGRGQNPPVGAPTPYVDWRETGSVSSSAVTDYQPCQVSLGSSTKLESVTGGAGLGGYASRDALLISNSYPGGTGPLLNQRVTTGYRYDAATATGCERSGRDYRTFDLTCAGYPVNVGGTPTGSYAPTYNATIPNVPTSAPVVATGACVYTGPTRVLLNPDGTATITSPWTTSAAVGSPSGCYPGAMANGISQFTTTALATMANFNGIISVKNKGTSPGAPAARHSTAGWNLTGQTANSTAVSGNTVFYLPSQAPASSPDVATTVPGTWTQPGDNANTWSMYSSTKKCGAVSRNTDTPNGPKPWDEQTFQCDWFGRMGDNTFLPPIAPNDAYTTYQNQLTTDLASTAAITVPGNSANTVTYSLNGGTAQSKTVNCSSQTITPATATPDQTVCLMQHDLRQANTGGNEANWSNPSQSGYTHQYLVSGYNQTTSTAPNTAVGATPSVNVNGDKLFDTTTQAGRASTETVTTTTTTYNVSSQVYGCYKYGLLGNVLSTPTGSMDVNGTSCTLSIPTGRWAWGDGNYPDKTSPQFQVTVTQKTYSNFVQGTSAAAYFPSMADVTQYAKATDTSNAPGDLYVEGTASSTLALVSANDTVVTGSLKSATSASAIEVVSQGNVRVYHPVQCASTTGVDTTTPGFCPNDSTGLYSGVAPTGFRPDQQYTNLRGDLGNLAINAAVFALGTPDSSGTLHNGQFGADNYNRGAQLGTITVTGTLTMQHHGPVGQEWEIPDATGQTSRPYSGYQLDLNYQNLKTPIAGNSSVVGVISTVSTTSSLWHVVSVSTGSGS